MKINNLGLKVGVFLLSPTLPGLRGGGGRALLVLNFSMYPPISGMHLQKDTPFLIPEKVRTRMRSLKYLRRGGRGV
jgi:hypothetical protein